MPIKDEMKLVCDYCGVEGTITLQKNTPEWTDWFVLCPAESLGSPLQTAQHVYCRKCKLRIEEIGKISIYRAEQIIQPPAPDDLLPEEDLPNTAFVNGYPNPEVACIGGGFHLDENLETSMHLKLIGLKRKNKDH